MKSLANKFITALLPYPEVKKSLIPVDEDVTVLAERDFFDSHGVIEILGARTITFRNET